MKSRLRVRGAAQPHRGRITVEYGRPFVDLQTPQTLDRGRRSGRELDAADKLCLVLFGQTGPAPCAGDPAGQLRVRESSFPIPWTEIVNISFQVARLVQAGAQSGAVG
jgi:hypothetical protein